MANAYDITTLSPEIQKQIQSGTPNIGTTLEVYGSKD